jgi:hypothetical protein
VMKADGTVRGQISVTDPTPGYPGDYNGAFTQPAYSPSGTSIVADYWPGSSLKFTYLVRIDLDSGIGTDLASTNFYGHSGNPDWGRR